MHRVPVSIPVPHRPTAQSVHKIFFFVVVVFFFLSFPSFTHSKQVRVKMSVGRGEINKGL